MMPIAHRQILLAAAATGALFLVSACGSNSDSAAGGKAALVEQAMEVYFDGEAGDRGEVGDRDCLKDALGKLSDADLRTLIAPLTEDEASLAAEEFLDASGDPPQIQAITEQCIGSSAPEDMVPAP